MGGNENLVNIGMSREYQTSVQEGTALAGPGFGSKPYKHSTLNPKEEYARFKSICAVAVSSL